jgi:hypothetical protein
MRAVVRTLADLGDELALAPERHVAARLGAKAGVPLGSIVAERAERVASRDLSHAVVLDTTHAKEGVIDVAAARKASQALSTKKRVREGDLLVSRLRPYLRQIALAHPAAVGREIVACSTEFYVFTANDGGDLAFLLPFLLGGAAQAALAVGQEGGHHPRVPLATLLGLRIPLAVVKARAPLSRAVRDALATVYDAHAGWAAVLSGGRAERC